MKTCKFAPLFSGLSLRQGCSGSYFYKFISVVIFSSFVFCEASMAGDIHKNLAITIPATGIESIRTNLYLLNADNTTLLMDGVLTEYSDTYHDSVYFEDAFKFTNITENLGLVRYGSVLSIERRPTILNSDTLFFKLWRTTRRSYQFEFITSNFNHPGMRAFLEDAYLNTSTEVALMNITKVNFFINTDAASANVNRFKIVYKTVVHATVLPVDFILVRGFKMKNKISIEWQVANAVNIQKYIIERSMNGNDFISIDTIEVKNINRPEKIYSWTDYQIPSKNIFYRIKSIGYDALIKYSKMVKIALENAGFNSVNMYPNPVVNKLVNLQFNNQQYGVYQLRLIANNAAVLFYKQVTVCGNMVQTLNFGPGIHAGMYQLQITAPDNTITTKKIVVQ